MVDEGDGREIILREKKKRVWLRLCFKFVVFVRFCLILDSFSDIIVLCCFGKFRFLLVR